MTWNLPPQSLLDLNPLLWGLVFLFINPPVAMAAVTMAAIFSAGRGI